MQNVTWQTSVEMKLHWWEPQWVGTNLFSGRQIIREIIKQRSTGMFRTLKKLLSYYLSSSVCSYPERWMLSREKHSPSIILSIHLWETNFCKTALCEHFLARVESLIISVSLKLSSYSEQVAIPYVSLKVSKYHLPSPSHCTSNGVSRSGWLQGRLRSDLTRSEVLACLGMVLNITQSTKIRVSIRTETKGEMKLWVPLSGIHTWEGWGLSQLSKSVPI